jgi:hypothetical protein
MLEKDLVKQFISDKKLREIYRINKTENSRNVIVPGWPDITLINRETKEIIGLEFKVGNNKQRINQIEMAKIFLANGINYYVIDEDNANDMTE